MLTLSLSRTPLWSNPAEGYFILLPESFTLDGDLKYIEEFYPHAAKILQQHNFLGKRGDTYTLTAEKEGRLINFIFLGIGAKKGSSASEVENLRRTIARGVQIAKRLKINAVAVPLPTNAASNISAAELIEQLGVAALMMSYEFEKYKTGKQQAPWACTLTFVVNAAADTSLDAGLKKASIIGNAMNSITRHLADLPPNFATPTHLSNEAAKIAHEHGLTYTCFGREKAEELQMGGFCSVDIGSEQEGKFVILEYKSTTPNVPTIALCGKGVTFDTGGISLKPSNYMCGMKFDMSGAAAVFATMAIVGQLKPNVNVIGLTPLVENMPSGKASRQDDIIVHLNGKTTEIKNTDAEGRLILSDTLCYAEKFYSPDVIIDIATLTGACVVALGHFYTGILSNDDTLSAELCKAGEKTGDRMWPLPLDDDYRDGIKSDVADMSNIAGPAYSAGTIEGAVYLQNFVSKAKWAHLDIAGTAHDVPAINYVGKGATGAGVRAMVEYILSKSK